MKGIVFTELIEMVEAKWGLAMTDRILQPEGLSSGGIFTAVGTYDFSDMKLILRRLSEATGMSSNDLQFHFGGYLFGSFVRGYSEMLARFDTTFGLLGSLDDFIHPEVQKLYPKATLPGFEVVFQDKVRMELHYRSKRKMPEFAVGLMKASAKHFHEEIKIEWKLLNDEEGLFRFTVLMVS